MKAGLLFLSLIIFLSCQTERSTPPTETLPDGSTPVDSTPDTLPSSTELLVIFKKERTALPSNNQLTINYLSIINSLPPGVYPIQNDTIIYHKTPYHWTSSGQLEWPENGKVALNELFEIKEPITASEIAIFPNRPEMDGKLEPCFACPPWMAEQYGKLMIIWETKKKSFVRTPEN